MTTDAAFWDKVAPKYAKSPIANPDAYEDTLARVRTYLGADTEALELGCGTGSTALKLFEGTRRYVATDFSPGMIDIARKKTEGMSDDAPEFRVSDIKASEFKGEGFNTVLAFNLLHLLPDLEAALDEIQAILPQDGLFISKSPALSEKWYYRPMIGAMRLIGKAPYVRCFTIAEYDAMIEAAGFRIVETGLYPPTTPSRFVVARKV